MIARRLTLATLASLCTQSRRLAVVLATVVCALTGSLVFASAPALASVHIFLTSFGSSGSGAGQVSLASNSGVAVNNATHDVYVADTGNARVDQFSSAGTFIRAWGYGVTDGTTNALQTCTVTCFAGLSGAGAGQFTTPTFVAVDNSIGLSQGDVYVGDTGTNTVSKFSASGAYVSSNNGSGATTPIAGPFGPLAGIAVDTGGNLWVYDGNANMFEFAQDGTFVTDWNSGRSVVSDGIDVDSAGNLYVITGGGSVEQFSATGTDVGPVNGDASNPTGFAFDRSSNELYMDSGGSLVRHYASSCDAGGNCTAVDSFGSGNLSGAAGLAVDSSAGAVYAADSGEQRVDVFGPPPAIPPTIDSTSVAGVGSATANLSARVNPNYFDTHYHFEYVSDASFQASGFAGAIGIPQPEGDLGSAGVDQSATVLVLGLLVNTTYHYRVVADNGNGGPQPGPARTFTTQPPGGAFQLPDGRGYEQVTPAVKGGGSLPRLPTSSGSVDALQSMGLQTSTSGDGIGYRTLVPLPGSQAGGNGSYLASRGAGGWSSQSLIPPQASTTFILQTPRIVAYSSDLSTAVLADGGSPSGAGTGQDYPPLVPGEPPNNQNLFLRDNTSASYQLMDVTPPGATPSNTGFEGASADFRHIIFGSVAKLTPDAIDFTSGTPAAGGGNLYEWFGGAVSLVGQVPPAGATSCGGGGPACVASPVGAGVGGGTSGFGTGGGGGGGRFLNAVSSDGSKVFFLNGNGFFLSPPFSPYQLYVRENGTTTVEVSASQKSNGSGPGGTDPNGPLSPLYWPASSDGSRAFFTNCEQLTNDSTADSTDTTSGQCAGGRDLYRYDTASGALADLTVDHNGDPHGADVQGVLGSSADGSYVYFVANGVLAPGASLGDCRFEGGAYVGQCSLYLSHGGATTFIARLDSGSVSANGDYLDWREFTARVTPDGTRLAFDSIRSLTGYDNTIAGGGPCGYDRVSGAPLPPACNEVFLYDAGTNRLVCASCNPSGGRPIGPSSIDLVEPFFDAGGSSSYLPRNLSADGSRLFFDSSDALVPGDTNGKQDVYEYANGRPYLISSGTSKDDSTFLDAGLSGNDVFFSTSAQLVGQDTDREFDIYDARVGGGFPGPPVPSVACQGDACQGPVAAPNDLTPNSLSFSGPGNPAAPHTSVSVTRPLTRAQKLSKALKACRKKAERRRRASCVAQARRLYGPRKASKKAAKQSTMHSGSGGSR